MKRRAFIGLTASNLAWANGLDQPGKGMATEPGTQAFIGELTVQQDRKYGHKIGPPRGYGRASALIVVSDETLRITFPISPAGYDEPDPSEILDLRRSCVCMLNPDVAQRLLFPSVFLSDCMKWAELKAEQDEVLDGRKVARATYALDGNWTRDPNGAAGGAHTLDIWTGDRDVPLQALEVEKFWSKAHGSETTRTARIRYAMSGQRLIATRLEERNLRTSPGGNHDHLDTFTLVARS